MVLEDLRGAPRAFKVLVASALIENMAFGLIIPYLAIYMSDEIHISAFYIGILLMAYTLAGMPAMVVGGMLADKIGRKAVLLSSLGLMSLTVLMYFFAYDFWSLLAISCADAFVGTMYMPAANAMIADVIKPGERPRAYSTLRIAWNVGIVFGPVVGVALVASMSIRILFLFGSVILAAAFLLNLFLIPETKPAVVGEAITFRKVLRVASDRPFLLLSLLSGIFWFFFSQWIYVLPLYATGQLGMQDYEYGLLFTVSAAMTVMFQLWVTSKMVLYTRSSVLTVGQLIASAGFALIFFATDFTSLLACIAVITVGEIVYMSIVSAVIADMSPEAKRGIYMGFSGFMQSFGSGTGFFFGLALLDFMPHKEWVWVVFGMIGFVSCSGYYFFSKMVGDDINRPKLGKAEPGQGMDV